MGVVVMVGKIENVLNGVNVIFGCICFFFDIRSEDDELWDFVLVEIL